MMTNRTGRVNTRLLLLAVMASSTVTGCASLSQKEKGAVIGATAGGVAGGVIGRNNGSTAKGAILGAAVGGAIGAVIGHQMDQQAKKIEQQVAGATVERVGEGIQVTFASGLRASPFVQARTDAYSLADLSAPARSSKLSVTRGQGVAGVDLSMPLVKRIATGSVLHATRERALGKLGGLNRLHLAQPPVAIAQHQPRAGLDAGAQAAVGVEFEDAHAQRIGVLNHAHGGFRADHRRAMRAAHPEAEAARFACDQLAGKIIAAGLGARRNGVGREALPARHAGIDACLKHGIPRTVHIGTDEVYGSIDEGSWDENEPLKPNSPYSAAKAAAELLVRAYFVTYGLNVSSTRCSNNYGPYQFPEKVIPLFVTNLIDGGKVPLYGDGLNVRDWLHVDDHCRGRRRHPPPAHPTLGAPT